MSAKVGVRIQAMMRVVDGIRTGLIVASAGVAPSVEMVGSVEVRLDKDTASLRALYVAPGFRRQGVGKRLFEAAADLARQHVKTSMAWMVKKGNLEALVFYLKQGATLWDADGEDFYLGVSLRAVEVGYLEALIKQRAAAAKMDGKPEGQE